MIKIQTVFRTVLLCTFSVLLINCNKDDVDVTTPSWNYSTFTDIRDGKTYKSIKIGNQEWMAENLAFETVNGSWNAGGSETYGEKYGRLYTWEAAKMSVPSGWHLPTDSEWKELEKSIGMSQIDADDINFRGLDEGAKLKSTTGWPENGNGIDNVGFFALPGGFRSNSGTFFVCSWYGYWWTSSESDSSNAWFRSTVYHKSKIYRNQSFKEDGYSVRCIKD